MAEPRIVESDTLITLQFSSNDIQSCMSKSDPIRLVLGYTRTMIGFALFLEQPAHIGIVGLGGGSLVKYCYRHFPQAKITVVEESRRVIELRNRFHIPEDDGRLSIVCAEGRQYMSETREQFDVLLLDGFRATQISRSLTLQTFYEDCLDRLVNHGVLVTNFLVDDLSLSRYLSSLHAAAGPTIVPIAAEANPYNLIAFARRNVAPPPLHALVRRALNHAGNNCVDLFDTAMRIDYEWRSRTIGLDPHAI